MVSDSPPRNVAGDDGASLGRIDRLELENFKSYRGRHVLGPFRQFSCIVGPNGAGKSNTLDAISFVLGVRAAEVRGSALKDLIHREADGQATAESCSVSLHFVDAEGREIVFRRSVTGAGNSQYQVNGKQSSQEAYIRALADHHIFAKTRNFLVFQGDIMTMALRNPKELTALFEEISGSGEFKEEYEDLKLEKERAEEDTLFNYQKKKGISAEKKRYKDQTVEAQKFRDLLDQEIQKKTELFLFQLYQMEREINDHMEGISSMQSEITSAEQEMTARNDEVAKVKKEFGRLNKEFIISEKGRSQKEKELTRLEQDEARIAEKMEHIKEKIKRSQRTRGQADKEKDALLEELARYEKELADVEKSIHKLEEEQRKARSKKISKATMDEYWAKQEEARSATGKLRQELSASEQALGFARASLEGVESKLREMESRKEIILETIKSVDTRKTDIETKISETTGLLAKLRGELSEGEEKLRSANTRKEQLMSLIDECDEKLKEANADSKELEREERFLESLESMKRLFPGVHGRIYDLCKPTQRKYNVAVTVAMGQHMDAIVVDNEKVALDCIRYLKDQRVGVATFVPLDTIKVKEVDESLRNLPGSGKLVIDLLQFDPSLRRAILYGVGSCVCFDTLDEARRYCFGALGKRLKGVTIDGTIIQKSGMMTGGISGIQGKAKRWDQKSLDAIKRSRAKYDKELREVGLVRHRASGLESLRSKVDGEESTLRYLKIDLGLAGEKLQSARKELSSIDAEMEKTLPERDVVAASVAKDEEKTRKLKEQVNELEGAIYSSLLRKAGCATVTQFEEIYIKGDQERNDRKLKLETMKSQWEGQVEYTKTRIAELDDPLSQGTASVTRAQKLLQKLEQERSAAKAQVDAMKAEVDELTKVGKALKKRAEDHDNQLKTLVVKRDEQSKVVLALKKKLGARETLVEQLKAKRHAILSQARVEEIPLPTTLDDEDSVEEPTQQDDSSQAMDTEASLNSQRMRRDVNRVSTLDFSMLPAELKKRMDATKREEKVAKLQDELEALRNEMERMAPNMKAEERLSHTRDRLKELEQDYDAAKQAAKGAAEKFKEVRRKRLDKFMEMFDEVASSIGTVYQELTRSKEYPLGGTAYLTLESSEEPFLHGIKFHAMPPSKRFRDMDQLSGGEKTMAALALIFAIQRVRPSPFFVLDEVDAALDSVNVAKLGRFLRDHCLNVQFIVISLKNSLFERSDALLGVFKDPEASTSGILSLDLAVFEE